MAMNGLVLPIFRNLGGHFLVAVVRPGLVLDEAEAAIAIEIFALEAAPQALGAKLYSLAVGNGLHRL
jgi:hypothetical protein